MINMNLKTQRKLASDVLRCAPSRVRFDATRLDEIKDAITKADIRGLVIDKAVSAAQIRNTSRGSARKIMIQKAKGRQRGQGSRKGKKTARLSKKESWMNKVRKQRELFRILRDKEMISVPVYREMYLKAKGGFFRSIRHAKLYLKEHGLIKEKQV